MTKKALVADLKAAGYRTGKTHDRDEGEPIVDVVLERADPEVSEEAQRIAMEHGYLVNFTAP